MRPAFHRDILSWSWRWAVSAVLVTLVAGSSHGLEAVELPGAEGQAIGSLDLSGTWEFLPLKDGGVAAEQADARAAAWGEDGPAAGAAGRSDREAESRWVELSVPQFLNRTVWWLSNISPEYEQQEKQRVAALGFDAEATHAGWYRKELRVPEGVASGEVRVRFEGVAMVSRVYCNGRYVGGHLGMFGEFVCRLTPHLRPGDNTLLVYVERGRGGENDAEVVDVAVTVPVTRGMLTSLNSGMFGGFGNGPRAKFMGIWQPVTLEIGRRGGEINDVFFNPRLDGHHLDVTIHNPTDQAISGLIQYELRSLDPNQDELLFQTTADPDQPIRLAAGESIKRRFSADGLSPKLWLPDDPHLYRLTVGWVGEDQTLIDEQTHDVGYRTVEIRGPQVWLNGHPYWSRGANMPPYGYKPNDYETARAFLQAMRDGNTPITRSHGNPFNRMWFELCDQIGIGVCVEGVRPWALMSKQLPPPQALLEHWKAEQLESVKQYRNHPSILFYCVSNEGLQGDHDDPEKLAIFGDIIAAMRELDPSRPIFQTSGDPDPAGHADMESIHAYWGWYHPSSYINDYSQPMRGLSSGGDNTSGSGREPTSGGRPFINMECAVPYQVLDTGAVHPVYKMHYSAHPWIGELGVHGDPKYFTEHVRAEAKMKAERLRWQRDGKMNAGVMLFSNVTWIGHALSRPPDQWKPFPVYDAVKQGFAPVLVAMESRQRVFYAEDIIPTSVHGVNDDTAFRTLEGLSVQAALTWDGAEQPAWRGSAAMDNLDYFQVGSSRLDLKIPSMPDDTTGPVRATLSFALLEKSRGTVSSNHYPIRVARRSWAGEGLAGRVIAVAGVSEEVEEFLKAAGATLTALETTERDSAEVVLLGSDATRVDPQAAFAAVKEEGRVLVLQQGAAAKRFVDDAVFSRDEDPEIAGDITHEAEPLVGEFVEMVGWSPDRALYDGLEAMDWKWWARGDGRPAYAASAGHRINPDAAGVTVLGRYLAPHLYWQGNLEAIYRSMLRYPVFAFAAPGRAEVVVCDLVIGDAIHLDPRAGRTLTNLLTQPVDAP